jgi:NADH dehydrogenase [ubiquinone] 1 alpha subcomplex assembly factor 1
MIVKVILVLLNYLMIMPQAEETTSKLTIADFTDNDALKRWSVVNDVVMGGVSTSEISLSENNSLMFSGSVSLENNGGFASIQRSADDFNFSDYEGFLIKVKGDGKTYNLSFRQTKYFTGYNYTHKFQTEKDNWQVVKLPFSEFKLKYYGREISNFEPPDKSNIKQMSILISDKQQGPFKIEIEWIGLY